MLPKIGGYLRGIKFILSIYKWSQMNKHKNSSGQTAIFFAQKGSHSINGGNGFVFHQSSAQP